nr:hypothetical protein [Tanacetum cinerariifolium]
MASLPLFTIIYASMPQNVDREQSLLRPLPPAAIVEPTKDDNMKMELRNHRLQYMMALLHYLYQLLNLTVLVTPMRECMYRMTRCSLKSGAGVDGSRKRDFKEPSEYGRFINTTRCKITIFVQSDQEHEINIILID